MFYLNLGYRWNHITLDRLEAAILLPSGSSIEKMTRSRPEIRNLLFDPQLYLAELDCGNCAKVCGRLVSYPWFGAEGVPDFDSSESNRRDWERQVRESIGDLWSGSNPDAENAEEACRMALEFQDSLTCTQLIIPSPLLREREDEAATQAAWLDSGLEAARSLEFDQPILGTVAIADSALNDAAFEQFGILETVVDQFTARDGFDGVYIVIAQSTSQHPFETPRRVLRAYNYLARTFSEAGYEHVITNFADAFGLGCLGVGATGFATGPSHALRRLSLESFDDEGFGRALPQFFSYPCVAELATESDLDVIRDNRLLRRVRDVTPVSERLMSTLAAGGSASTLVAWAEGPNNVKAAQSHFLTRMIIADDELAEMDAHQRSEAVSDWLETAAANRLFIHERLGAEFQRLRGHFAPAGVWAAVLEV